LYHALGSRFRIFHSTEFSKRRCQEHVGDTETWFATNGPLRCHRSIFIAPPKKVTHANAVQRRRNPRIERTKADTRSPQSIARSASPPQPKINAPQEYAHAADGEIARAASNSASQQRWLSSGSGQTEKSGRSTGRSGFTTNSGHVLQRNN
jgi:hypothetical protein